MKRVLNILCLVCTTTLFTYAQSTSFSANDNNITGNQTVAIGFGTATTPNFSIFLGYKSGENAAGVSNVCIGRQSGGYALGSNNTYIGTSAGAISEGSHNVVVGNSAGTQMGNNATHNLIFGYEAGDENEGTSNVMIGQGCAPNNRGNENIFIGNYVSSSNQGDYNVYVGKAAAENNSGSRNVFLGHNAGQQASGLSDKLIIENSNAVTPLIYGDFSGNKVGINTTNMPNTIGGQSISDYSLYVEGGLLSDEVRVRTTWADYVFKEDYNLKSISELDNFIIKNGHLPNCPSEEQVNVEGIEIGDITRIQQEKIEELTLYLIEQHKLIQELKNDVQHLNQHVLSQDR